MPIPRKVGDKIAAIAMVASKFNLKGTKLRFDFIYFKMFDSVFDSIDTTLSKILTSVHNRGVPEPKTGTPLSPQTSPTTRLNTHG
jgi:hypothetical protein